MADPTADSAPEQASRHDPVYDRLVETAEFEELRTRFRNFVWPATAIFLGWYLLYVVMSNWATDFMSHKLWGNINVALVFGLLQFLTTFVIAALYARYMNNRVDPIARQLVVEYAKEARSMSSETLTGVLFVAVVLVTVGITFWASRQGSGTTDYYAGGRNFSGFQNGMAVSGDYMSAASFLGISGLIALNGYDGFLYSIGFLVAWLVALLLVAELLRNSGRYTMADQLAFRMRQRPVRTAAATSTVVVSIFYLLAQMVGAGALVALLLGIESEAPQGTHDRGRRPADGLLRHRRWHEGHYLGADRQGGPADERHRADHRARARQVRLQPLRAARRCRGEDRQGRRPSSSRV